jgi:cell division protein ZapA (FtsZ GTPase activity inhibitor)
LLTRRPKLHNEAEVRQAIITITITIRKGMTTIKKQKRKRTERRKVIVAAIWTALHVAHGQHSQHSQHDQHNQESQKTRLEATAAAVARSAGRRR